MEVFIDMSTTTVMNISHQDESVPGKGFVPSVYYFSRDENRERVTHKITDRIPYFYGACGKDDKGAMLDYYGRYVRRIDRTVTGYEHYRLPRDTTHIRDKFSYYDEADVLFHKRVYYDSGIYRTYTIDKGKITPLDYDPSNMVRPRIGYFDIEVESPPEIFPGPEETKYKVVSFQYCDSYTGEVVVVYYKGKADVPKYIVPSGDYLRGYYEIEADIRIVSTERELFEELTRVIQEYDPDILAGWNTNQYDWPYLINRARRERYDLRGVSPLGTVYTRRQRQKGAMSEWEPVVKGRTLLDLQELYKKLTKPEGGTEESYDLKNVARRRIEFYYEDYGNRIQLLRERDALTLLDYCIRDAYVLYLLDQDPDMGIIEFYDDLRSDAGCLMEDTPYNAKLIDGLCLRLTDVPLPSKVYSRDREEVKGGRVDEPAPGVHPNVGVFDLTSLYPFLVGAYNIGGDTLRAEPNEFTITVGDPDIGIWHFDKRKESLLAKILRILITRREKFRAIGNELEAQITRLEIKKEYLEVEAHKARRKGVKRRETVAKFLTTSVYGVNAYPGFRLHHPGVANAITYLGRLMIMKLGEWTVMYDYVHLYGDTDSTFAQFDSSYWEDAYVLEDYLNEELAVYGEKLGLKFPMTVKLEKFFKTLLFAPPKEADRKKGREGKKKAYSGWLIMKDGEPRDEILTMGFANIKSDTSAFVKQTMDEVFNIILRRGDAKMARRFLMKKWKELSDEDPFHIARPKGLSKDPRDYKIPNCWVKGAVYAQVAFGHQRVDISIKPKHLYVKRMGYKHVGKYPRFVPNPDPRTRGKQPYWTRELKRKGIKVKTPYDMESICYILNEPDEIPATFWEDFKIDWDKMREVLLENRFQEIMYALGYEWGEVSKGQTKLESFF